MTLFVVLQTWPIDNVSSSVFLANHTLMGIMNLFEYVVTHSCRYQEAALEEDEVLTIDNWVRTLQYYLYSRQVVDDDFLETRV